MREDVSTVVVLQYGATLTHTTINAALSAIGSQAKVLLLTPGTWILGGNVTVPRNVTLWIPHGTFVDATGGSLTVNGPIMPPPDALWYIGNVTLTYPQVSASLPAHVLTGCLPTVSGSLTLAGFACTGVVHDGPTTWPVSQASAPVTVPNAPTIWLALHRSTSAGVAGWTRQSGTHYLVQASATRPADPPGGLVFAQLTVAGAAITQVADLRWLSPEEARLGVVMPTSFGARPDDGADDTAAFQQAITSARSKRTSVYVPSGTYDLSQTLVLGGHGVVPVNLVGASSEWTHTPSAATLLRANMNAAMVQLKGNPGFGEAGIATGTLIRDLGFVNENPGSSNIVVNISHVHLMRLENLNIRTAHVGVGHGVGESLIITSMFRNLVIVAPTQTTTNTAYQGDFWNVSIFGGRIQAFGRAFGLTGSSTAVYGIDAELNQIFLQTGPLGNFACFGCHIETTNVLVTNAVTVPITITGPWPDTGPWVDAGGEGHGITGTVLFENCFFGLLESQSNEIVLKGAAGFGYHLTIRGGNFVGTTANAGGSFTPNATVPLPVGTVIVVEGPARDGILWNRAVDSFSNFISVDRRNVHSDRLFATQFLEMAQEGAGQYGAYVITNGLELRSFATTRLRTLSPDMFVGLQNNHFQPGLDNVVDLGDPALRFKSIYMSGTVDGLKVKILPLASLPAGSAVMDGAVFLVEVAPGSHAFVYYVGGERYHVTGTVAP